MEIIVGLLICAVAAYVFIFKKDKATVTEAMSDAPAQAPYKTEPEPITAETQAALQKAHDEVVLSGQPDDSKGLDEAIAAVAAATAQPELKVVNGKGTGKSATKSKKAAPAKKVAPAKKPAAIKAKKPKQPK